MPFQDQGLDKQYYSFIPRTLIFITWERHVLLIKGAPNKKRWANLYNGIGGHFELGEDIYQCARREVFEEAGVDVPELWLCGIVTIDTGTNPGICLFVFRGEFGEKEKFEVITGSEEGVLEWIEFDNISTLPVVEDIPELLTRVFASTRDAPPFVAHYSYDQAANLDIRFLG
jgi:8-oxo-dGTP diphosphatase